MEPPFFGRATFLKKILKIHGSLDSTMLIGVDDKSQIANPIMSENRDICDFLIKPQANYVIGSMRDSEASNLIFGADIIIVYGMSIGTTDKGWWQSVYNRVLQNPAVRLLLFYYTEGVDKRREYKSRSKKEEFKDHFFDVVGADPSDRDSVSKRVFVSLSKKFFALENE